MNAAPSVLPDYLHNQIVHKGARIVREEPLTIETPDVQWAYAVSLAPQTALADGEGTVASSGRFVFDITVTRGAVGVGWTNPEGTAFLDERFSSGGDSRLAFRLDKGQQVGRLIFRNVAASGTPSEFVLRRAAFHAYAESGYRVSVAPRNVLDEMTPAGGGTEVFDTEAARVLNAARLAWLGASNLPVHGRVLDIGAGVGHFTGFYKQHGCVVVAVDGRDDNITELRRRHPDVESHVADAQELDPAAFGQFDVVHCFGLLYHLDSPVAALRRFHAMCRGVLVLETMTCDSSRPVAVLVDESKAVSQAMQGLGSRPSPAFLTLALNRVGFRYVYGARVPPQHPDFQFEFRDDLSITRNDIPMRCVMVASHTALDLPSLIPLLES